ncbi:MAG: hypothetical protein ACFE95_13435 [Candidatus Hodarchaeota archaeon]
MIKLGIQEPQSKLQVLTNLRRYKPRSIKEANLLDLIKNQIELAKTNKEIEDIMYDLEMNQDSYDD